MITLRRADGRQHHRRRKQESWHTFYAEDGALNNGFGSLLFLNEDRVPRGAGMLRRTPPLVAEILTYVREGALAYDDSKGRTSVIQAGEFRRTPAANGTRHTETTESLTDSAHVFEIGLSPSEPGRDNGYEQKRFSVAERRGGLCVVASPDARRGSLRLRQDVVIYSAVLDSGQHVVHELSPGRSAWLHVVEGEVTLGDNVLTAGDGAGITAERVVSLTAREDASIFLIDLGEQLAVSLKPPGDPRYARVNSRLRAVGSRLAGLLQITLRAQATS